MAKIRRRLGNPNKTPIIMEGTFGSFNYAFDDIMKENPLSINVGIGNSKISPNIRLNLGKCKSRISEIRENAAYQFTVRIMTQPNADLDKFQLVDFTELPRTPSIEKFPPMCGIIEQVFPTDLDSLYILKFSVINAGKTEWYFGRYWAKSEDNVHEFKKGLHEATFRVSSSSILISEQLDAGEYWTEEEFEIVMIKAKDKDGKYIMETNDKFEEKHKMVPFKSMTFKPCLVFENVKKKQEPLK